MADEACPIACIIRTETGITIMLHKKSPPNRGAFLKYNQRYSLVIGQSDNTTRQLEVRRRGNGYRFTR